MDIYSAGEKCYSMGNRFNRNLQPEDKQMRFQNKTAVISGGASGMGLLCGQCYAKEGANVVLTDVNSDALNAAVESIRSEGGTAMGVVTDVRVYAQTEAACNAAVQAYGSLDILVNCAGGASSRIFGVNKLYHEYPVDVLDWGMQVNLMGPMYFTRAAMPQMVKQKSGVIIVMGSISGKEGSAYSVDYCTAKSALMNGFVQSIAQSGAPYGIRACSVAPGPVLTRAAMAKMPTMMHRAAQPQEIVDLILYLSSDKASFITGTNYMIDGGGSRGW